jgi:hypothetical protein
VPTYSGILGRGRLSKVAGVVVVAFAQELPVGGATRGAGCKIVALASELTAWMQMLALADHPARRWEPKRLRLHLFSAAARIARYARRTRLRLSAHHPWTDLVTTALTRLQPG